MYFQQGDHDSPSKSQMSPSVFDDKWCVNELLEFSTFVLSSSFKNTKCVEHPLYLTTGYVAPDPPFCGMEWHIIEIFTRDHIASDVL